MFFKYQDLSPGALPPSRAERAERIAGGLPESEIRMIERRFVKLYLSDIDEVIDGDVTRSGITVYLGGFDWVTFPTPPHLLQKFPEFMPLPQQVFPTDETL